MKRILLWLPLILFLFSSVSSASDFNGFFALDQIKNSVEIYDGLQRITNLKIGPKPARVVKNPNNGGYLIMYRGVKRTSGGLVSLDRSFQTVGRTEFPGTVVQDFYLKERGLWLLFTVARNNGSPPAKLNYYDIKTGETSFLSLNGPPSAYWFNEDRTQLAVGTLGNAKNNAPAQVVLIDIARKQARMFPVSANPGAIYQTPSGKMVVACGGFRNNQKYSPKTLIERTETAEPAKLHWIDPETGNTEVVELGYSPLYILQDQYDRETFHAVSTNVYDDPNGENRGLLLGNITNNAPERPAAAFYKIVAADITASIKLTNQPTCLIQTSSARVCVPTKNGLSIIDLSGPVPKLTDYSQGRDIDEFLVNNDGTVGYISNANSNYLDIIDLKTGKEIKIVKISNTFYIGKMSLDLFGSGLPPVIKSDSAASGDVNNLPRNRRMFLAKDFSRLYILAGAPEVAVVNLQTGATESVLKFFGSPYGIHPVPNGKFIAVATDNGWRLLDPAQSKTVLNLILEPDETGPGPENGYYSPDGGLLVIPFKNYLYLIDPINGVPLGKVRSKIDGPQIVWPE